MTRSNLRTLMLTGIILCLSVSMTWAKGSSEGKDSGNDEITMIHFYSPVPDDANSNGFAKTMSEFRSKNPGITVSDEFIQHDNYEMKLKTMVATQSLPDVFLAKPDLFPVLRENGLILSVDDILSADSKFASAYKSGAFSDFEQEGKTWGFPFQLQSNHVVYYNKDLFAKAGYPEFPKTMDEFLQACKDLNSMGVIPFAMGNKGKWLAPSCIFNTMAYRYVGPEWFDSLYNDKGAKFTDEGFVDAARLMVDMVNSGAFNEDMNSIDNNQQRTLLYSGEAAMFVEGSWALGPVIDNTKGTELEGKIGLAVLPPANGHKDLANLVAGGAGWAVCINASMPEEHKAVVVQFVKEVFGQTFANTAAMNGGFPAMVPQIDASQLSPLQVEYNKLPLAFGPIFDVQLPATIVDVFYNDLQKLLMGSISPEDYAANVEAAR